MSLALSPDENPRESTELYLKLRREEYDVLVQAAEQYGVDTDTWDRLETPALKHNNGLSQFLRLVAQGEVSASDFESVPAVESQEGNRFVKVQVALMPSEIARVEDSISADTLRNDFRNRDVTCQKFRQGVILPFIQEVTASE